jgi:hypothetical protein
MKYLTQKISTTNHKPGAHQMNPRKNHIFKIGLLAFCSIFSSTINAEILPNWDAGLTFTTGSGSFTQPVAGVFPGTNLKFYPGFVIAGTENESLSSIESRWQELFSGSRKQTYRPPGIYGGISRGLSWKRYYVDQNVRPRDPSDHSDPAYDWSLLDAVFNLNSVQNEGALVKISVGEVSYGGSPKVPAWLINSPYDGTFNSGKDGGSGGERITPKYYRDDIVQEYIDFNQALHDHLVATGNIDKIMFLTLSEFHVSGSAPVPPDYDATTFTHGVGKRSREVAKIWARSGVIVMVSSLSSSRRDIYWEYMDNPTLGATYPDMKMSGTNNITSSSTRFSDMNGINQKDTRPLSQGTEGNGQRLNTYFAPDIPNPWGYSDVSKPQTASHILWALSGSPKGANKDSGLGQAGNDPAGVMPVHTIIIDFGRTWQDNSPSVEEWHEAIDTFGPPGTYAFPYLPQGYEP